MVMPKPTADLGFFAVLKTITEKYWSGMLPDETMYGLQIQRGSQWCSGLSDSDIDRFGKHFHIEFPFDLRCYYKTMNGLSLPGIDLYACDGRDPDYRPYFYSYPDSLPVMKRAQAATYEAKKLTPAAFFPQNDVSPIFPITPGHFVLTAEPGCPVVSIYGDQVLLCADSLCKFLVTECLGDVLENVEDYDNTAIAIRFWGE